MLEYNIKEKENKSTNWKKAVKYKNKIKERLECKIWQKCRKKIEEINYEEQKTVQKQMIRKELSEKDKNR